MSRPSLLVSLAMVVCAGGCGEPPKPVPETHPVTGTVLRENEQPLAGGIIQFISSENPNLNMSAMIEPDGTFELCTLHVNENLPGAIAGVAEVTVMLPIQGGKPPKFLILPEPYEIRAGKNHFTIHLDRAAR